MSSTEKRRASSLRMLCGVGLWPLSSRSTSVKIVFMRMFLMYIGVTLSAARPTTPTSAARIEKPERRDAGLRVPCRCRHSMPLPIRFHCGPPSDGRRQFIQTPVARPTRLPSGTNPTSLVTTILAVVPMVAHHEVVAGRHLVRTAAAQRAPRVSRTRCLCSPSCSHPSTRAGLLLVRPGELDRHQLAVDRNPLVGRMVFDYVTRQPYDALDVVHARIRRQAKYDHVAALRLAELDDLGIYNRQA